MSKKTNVTYNTEAKIVCASCSTEYIVGATFESLKIDICGHCHPAYTGKSILIDTAGQLKKFKDRLAKATDAGNPIASKKTKVRRTKLGLIDVEEQTTT